MHDSGMDGGPPADDLSGQGNCPGDIGEVFAQRLSAAGVAQGGRVPRPAGPAAAPAQWTLMVGFLPFFGESVIAHACGSGSGLVRDGA
jgi:hypothetical protein